MSNKAEKRIRPINWWWAAIGSVITALSALSIVVKYHDIGISETFNIVFNTYCRVRNVAFNYFNYIAPLNLSTEQKDSLVILVMLLAVYLRSLLYIKKLCGRKTMIFVVFSFLIGICGLLLSDMLIAIESCAASWFSNCSDSPFPNTQLVLNHVHGLILYNDKFANTVASTLLCITTIILAIPFTLIFSSIIIGLLLGIALQPLGFADEKSINWVYSQYKSVFVVCIDFFLIKWRKVLFPNSRHEFILYLDDVAKYRIFGKVYFWDDLWSYPDSWERSRRSREEREERSWFCRKFMSVLVYLGMLSAYCVINITVAVVVFCSILTINAFSP